MKWSSVKDFLILTGIIVFFALIIMGLTKGFWVMPIFPTTTDKILSLMISWAFFIVCLGAMILSSNKLGRELRGETEPEKVRKYDYLIFIAYVVWVILWQLIDPSDSHRHYQITIAGLLLITIVWYEWNTKVLKKIWWKIIE